MNDEPKITYKIKLPEDIPGWATNKITVSLLKFHDGRYHSNQNFVNQEEAEKAMKWNIQNDAKEQGRLR